MLTGAIKYKLAEGNGVFVEVPTKKVKPSQTCPQTSELRKKAEPGNENTKASALIRRGVQDLR